MTLLASRSPHLQHSCVMQCVMCCFRCPPARPPARLPGCAEVERERECVCIVAHQAVLRALYGYFMNRPLEVGHPLVIPRSSLSHPFAHALLLILCSSVAHALLILYSSLALP